MEVRTSRSVVQLGEPVELDITIKSNQRLDALALGKLDGDGGLPRDKFTVPVDPPTGTLANDGKTKTFKVVAQVTGLTTEIPAIAFAYFDPAKRTFFLWEGRAFSFAEADTRVSNVVKGLVQCGIHAGDRVAVVMGSRPSFLTMVTALSRLGAVAVPGRGGDAAAADRPTVGHRRQRARRVDKS